MIITYRFKSNDLKRFFERRLGEIGINPVISKSRILEYSVNTTDNLFFDSVLDTQKAIKNIKHFETVTTTDILGFGDQEDITFTVFKSGRTERL